jgi:hypothetical protein
MAAAEYGGVPETGRERQLSTALIRADGLRRLDSFLGHRSARPMRPLRVIFDQLSGNCRQIDVRSPLIADVNLAR